MGLPHHCWWVYHSLSQKLSVARGNRYDKWPDEFRRGSERKLPGHPGCEHIMTGRRAGNPQWQKLNLDTSWSSLGKRRPGRRCSLNNENTFCFRYVETHICTNYLVVLVHRAFAAKLVHDNCHKNCVNKPPLTIGVFPFASSQTKITFIPSESHIHIK